MVQGNRCCLSLSVFEAAHSKCIKARNAVRDVSRLAQAAVAWAIRSSITGRSQRFFSSPKTRPPGATQQPFQWCRGFCLKYLGVNLITHVHLVPRLRVCGAEPYSAPAILLHDLTLTVYFYLVAGNFDEFPLRQRVNAGLSLSPHVCLYVPPFQLI